MMCQRGFIHGDDNKGTTLVRGAGGGGGCVCGLQGVVYGNFLFLPLNFAVILK